MKQGDGAFLAPLRIKYDVNWH